MTADWDGRAARAEAFSERVTPWGLAVGAGGFLVVAVVGGAGSLAGVDDAGSPTGALGYLAVSLSFAYRAVLAFRRERSADVPGLVAALLVFVGAVVAAVDEFWPSVWAGVPAVIDAGLVALVALGGVMLAASLRRPLA